MRVSFGFGENTSAKSTSRSQWRKDVQVYVSDAKIVFEVKQKKIVLFYVNFCTLFYRCVCM